jgi:hypothetical protein
MKELNFVTMCDNNYFTYVKFSAKQLMKFYPECSFYVYDWGFTKSQKNILDTFPIIKRIEWYDKIYWENGYKRIPESFEGYTPPGDILIQRKKEYLFSQVPLCILDCAKRINENLIVLDADCFLINKIDEIFVDDFDVGITLRPKEDIERANKLGISAELNTAVLFFLLNSKRIQTFIKEWIREIETSKKAWIDQTSLIELIKKRKKTLLTEYYNVGIINISNIDFKIKTFPCNIYGRYTIEKGYNDKEVKILHFKSERRRAEIRERIRGVKIYLIISKILIILPKSVKHRIFIDIKMNLLTNFIIHPKKIKKVQKFLLKRFKILDVIRFLYKILNK